MLFGRWRILFFHKPLLRVARIDPDQTRIKMSRVFYDIQFFTEIFERRFAGGCVIPLLSERSEVRGVTRRNNAVKYYWKISSVSR
jgi:hypothetical protein